MTSAAIFDAWGTQMNPAATRLHPFTYTGREVGEAGLLGYRARWYQPAAGRFTSQDMILTKNPFAYIFNNPVGYHDPSGQWPTKREYGVGGPVHQNAIDRALNFLPASDREYLEFMQVVADLDQSEAGAFKHAMTVPGLGMNRSWNKADCYVRDLMARAMALEKNGQHLAALRLFAMALHTVQDATSPAHYLFQVWHDPYTGDSTAKEEGLHHVLMEDFDPGAGSELDRATLWMWNIFAGKVEMPTDFFLDIKPVPARR
jgi:RHS repeat-associated protein